MSTLWPQGEDKSLLYSIIKYLKSLSSSKLSDEEKDSLGVAIDSLHAVLGSDNIPNIPFNLVDLYTKYLADHDEKAPDTSKTLSPELQERKQKFLEFVELLKTHKFFGNCTEGSQEYFSRLEQARVKYNDKFPKLGVPSLAELRLTPENYEANQKNLQSENITQRTEESATSFDTKDIKTPEQRKSEAEILKNEGNELLSQHKFNEAIKKYNAAITLVSDNAVYYSNRAAAYTYIKNYGQAAGDAKKSIELDPKYTKAYIRLGVAEFELGNYEAALKAYQKALDYTPPSDPNWEQYQEKVTLCKQKLETNDNDEDDVMGDVSGLNSSDPSNLFAGLGGQQGLSDLLGGSGGMQNILKNPMFQQMAQQVLKNPDMMKQMGQMMNNPQFANTARDMMGGGSDPDSAFMKVLQDPVKSKQVFEKVQTDPEFVNLQQQNPELSRVVSGFQNGDMSAATELLSKPDLLVQLKKIAKKHL